MDNIELRAHLLAVEYVKHQVETGKTPDVPIAYANTYKLAYKQILSELKKGF